MGFHHWRKTKQKINLCSHCFVVLPSLLLITIIDGRIDYTYFLLKILRSESGRNINSFATADNFLLHVEFIISWKDFKKYIHVLANGVQKVRCGCLVRCIQSYSSRGQMKITNVINNCCCSVSDTIRQFMALQLTLSQGYPIVFHRMTAFCIKVNDALGS